MQEKRTILFNAIDSTCSRTSSCHESWRVWRIGVKGGVSGYGGEPGPGGERGTGRQEIAKVHHERHTRESVDPNLR
jgi:hypothetical protein